MGFVEEQEEEEEEERFNVPMAEQAGRRRWRRSGEQCNALRAEIDNLRENPLLTELGHSWTDGRTDGGQSIRPDSVSRCCTRLEDEGKEGRKGDA